MKRNKQAVSLITLVITIIVMTIIAGTIILTLSDTNIFNKAGETVNMQNEKEEITYIQSKIAFYAIEKNKTFYEFIKQEFGENNVKDNLDDTYTITLESGNSYIVEEKGKIRPAKGIYVEATGFPLMLKDGETVTGTLKATLVDISGEITWSIENESIAIISGTAGESITVTAVSQGKTKVTASCNGYTREYVVKVSAEVPLGAYVEYDVSYDKYTSENGWRYFGLDEEGNKLLISTQCPVGLINSEKASSIDTLKWWDKDDTLNPNERTVNGLLNNFSNIPYYRREEGEIISAFVHPGAAVSRYFDGENYNSGNSATTTLGDCFIDKEFVDIIKNVRTLTFEEFKDRAGIEKLEENEVFRARLGGAAQGLLYLGELDQEGGEADFNYFLATVDQGSTTDVLVYGDFYSQSAYITGIGGYRQMRPTSSHSTRQGC